MHFRSTLRRTWMGTAGAVLLAHPAYGQHTPVFADLAAEVRSSSALVGAAYRHIHERPELGKQEVATAEYLRSELQQIGYTEFVPSQLAPTAVIAVLDTGRPGHVVALRAEMDARKAQEPADHDPRSQIAGLMHNCGHDAHAAMLLGAADLLFRNRARLVGKVVFLFQPGEETAGGADDIVQEGILERLGVESIFAQHAVARMPVGTISVSSGPTLAGSTSFTIRVAGVSSHAAEPFRGSDVAVAAARIAAAVAEFPARHLDVIGRPTVISVAFIHAGVDDQVNLLPDSATIRGTIRSFEEVDAAPTGGVALSQALRTFVENQALAAGVTATLVLKKGSPPTINNTALFAQAAARLGATWPGRLDTTPYRGMFAEDFSYYTEHMPALYFGLGIARDGLGSEDVHKPGFTIHPAALDEGVRLLALLAEIGTGSSATVR